MGFEFKQTFVPVEINGKEYQVRVGILMLSMRPRR